MPLIKNGELIADSWVEVASEESLPEGSTDSGDIIVTLDHWQAERETLKLRNGRLGIRLSADQLADSIAEDVESFDLIALTFPKFQDGRAYSTARLLRERHGFKGELRATGAVHRDQFFFMARCGFDTYQVQDEKEVNGFAQAMEEIGLSYQPAGDSRRPLYWHRHDINRRPEAC